MVPPAGSLIAFATDVGRVAFDGDGANGLYTEELLKNMRSPGLTIEQVFKRTRAGVLARSEGGQVPAEYSPLIGDDIYLAGQAATPPPILVPSIAAPIRAEAASANPPLDPPALTRLAAEGRSEECVQGLELLSRSAAPGDYSLPPLEALLERVKEDLQDASEPSTKVITAAETCESVLRLLPLCLPKEHPQAALLAAKARNRRGDALLLLGRAKEAIQEFDAAIPLAPTDAYILYNRGRAKLAVGKTAEARTDFATAASDQFDQPKAKKLALEALAAMADEPAKQ